MSEVIPQRRVISRLPRERRVADIMEAAHDVFCERGYADASISDIAERAHVVEGTIYRYFENKRELLVRVVGHWYEEMLADYDTQLSGIKGTRNRLRFLIWRHLRAIKTDPALCRLVFSELRAGPDYRETRVFDLNRDYTRRTLDILRDAIAAGEFRDDAPLTLVRDMIYGGIEHHTWAFLRGEGDFPLDETADAITDFVYRALVIVPADDMTLARIEQAAAKLERLIGKAEA